MNAAEGVRSPTRVLAEFVSGFRFSDIPAEIVSSAKYLMLDTLGCALYGSVTPWGRIILQFVKESGVGEGALLWGEGSEVPPPNAPLANGTLVHSFELDDIHLAGHIHPGAVVLPAADCVVRRAGAVDGRRFLAAFVAGYEVGIRIGKAGGTSSLGRGLHTSTINGPFAAAAAAGRLLGLDADRMVHAFGVAGSQSAGLMAAQHGAMVKRMHLGRAAQSGVYGALLAERGFTGIENILEAPYGGFYAAHSGGAPDWEVLTGDLGRRFEIPNVDLKAYPSCAGTHTSLDAFRRIRERRGGIDPGEIEKIVVGVSEGTKKHVCWPYVPDSVTTAQMNLPFCLSALVLDREFFVDQVGEDALARPDILEMTKKIESVVDPEMQDIGGDARHAAKVEVRLKDGTRAAETVLRSKGSGANPLTPAEVERKYRTLASKVLSPRRVDRLEEAVLGFEKLGDARLLGELLRPE